MASLVTKFIGCYRNFKKVIPVIEFDELYDGIVTSFSVCPGFESDFIIQYEDKDVDDFIDLDNMEMLHNRKSNRLLILVDVIENVSVNQL